MKAKLVVHCPAGAPLAAILTYLASQPVYGFSVEFDKAPTPQLKAPAQKKKPLIRDQIVAEYEAAKRAGSKTVMKEALADSPKSMSELRKIVEEAGYVPNSADWALAGLLGTGHVKRDAEGVYSLTPAEEASAISPEPPGAPAKSYRRGIDVIVDVLADGAAHERAEIKEAFMAAGFEGKSLDARLFDATKRGLAVRLGDGHWQRTEPGRDNTPHGSAS